MWILSGNERSPGVIHYIPCNRDVLVGRRTDIRLEDDKSISRTHACIHVTYRLEDVLSSSSHGEVKLFDRSKYGTSVNGQRLNGDCTVADGTVITFGLQWNTWTLSWRPLSVATSLLSRSERDSLKQTLVELGGTLLAEWEPPVNYLVMSSFKMSVKAVLALASGTPAVTSQFLHEMAVCLRSGVAPDVDPAGFEPVLDEPTLTGSDCNIGVVKKRSTLFFGKRFVFAEEAQRQRMKLAIELAGGAALLLADCGLAPAELAARDVIVMDTELKSPDINRLKAVLKRARRRLVKDQEIGLAILRTSTERDCNPAFDYRTSFVPPLASTQSQSMIGAVLARETQASEQPAVAAAASAAADRQTRMVVSPTPATPSGGGGDSLAESTAMMTASGGVVPPTPTTAATRQSGSSAGSRPAAADWPAGPDAKRRRPAATDGCSVADATAVAGPAPPSLDALASSCTVSAGGRRSRQSPAEEPQPVFKRPKLSEAVRSRPAPAGDDLFDFDLELGGRPAPPPSVKREPAAVPETPPTREPEPEPEPEPIPGRHQRIRAVKSDPEPAGEEEAGWISSCRRTDPPPPAAATARTEAPTRLEQMSIAEDGGASELVHSCVRLQISALIRTERPRPDTTAAADTSADGPNFKRFKRVRQPPLCPRIIGGSDLYVNSAHRSSVTNGYGSTPPNGGEDDIRLETRRQEASEEDLFRLLDGVGRGDRRRRRGW